MALRMGRALFAPQYTPLRKLFISATHGQPLGAFKVEWHDELMDFADDIALLGIYLCHLYYDKFVLFYKPGIVKPPHF